MLMAAFWARETLSSRHVMRSFRKVGSLETKAVGWVLIRIKDYLGLHGYARLAQTEEAETVHEFGREYRVYMRHAPVPLPLLVGGRSAQP
jgi:protein-S-isoprenylcysteine O-methyltransferase Ste14